MFNFAFFNFDGWMENLFYGFQLSAIKNHWPFETFSLTQLNLKIDIFLLRHRGVPLLRTAFKKIFRKISNQLIFLTSKMLIGLSDIFKLICYSIHYFLKVGGI